MKKMFLVAAAAALLIACNNKKSEESKTEGTDSTGKMESKTPPQSEFADAKYTDWGKKMSDQLSSGDMDGWLSNYADNAVYAWSGGDSLAGKAAIGKFWKDRRMNVIESIQFSNDIWLPIKVNTSQKGPDMPGVWLMSWSQVDVKYKKAKNPIMFWVHNLHHFDMNDKIDRTVSFIDFAPINKAMGK